MKLKLFLMVFLLIVTPTIALADLPTELNPISDTEISSKINSTEYIKDGVKIVFKEERNILDKTIINWKEDGNIFYPEFLSDDRYEIVIDSKTGKVISKTMKPLPQAEFYTEGKEFNIEGNKLVEPYKCYSPNQFYTYCTPYQVIDFNLAEKKVNNITSENIIPLYNETFDYQLKCIKEILGGWDEYRVCMTKALGYTYSAYGLIYNLDPLSYMVYTSTSQLLGNGSDEWRNQTEVSAHGVRIMMNASNWTATGLPTQKAYNYSTGSFNSFVFYNSTSSYWNTTLSLADSNGSAEVYDLCLNDANCVSYWSLDTLNGTSVYNDKKGTNHGTPTGTNNATGISSGAVRFDGDNDYVNLSNDASLNLIGNFSIFMWINPENPSLYYRVLYEKAGQFEYLFWNTNSKLMVKVGADTTSSNTVIPANEWSYVGITFNGTNIIYYLNGQDDGGFYKGSNYASSSSASMIGIRGTLALDYLGSIDEVLIYNKSLTASEVEQLYKAGLSQHANANVTLHTRTADSYNLSDAGLVSLWSFNADNSTTAFDETGRNNGTRQGSIADATEGNGTVGKGYSFDGVNDYINISDDSSIRFNGATDDFTMSIWTRFDTDRTYNTLIDKRDANNDGYLVLLNSGVVQCSLDYKDMVGTTILDTDNQWHHIVCSIDKDGTSYIFIDGVQDASYSFAGEVIDTSIDVYIGRASYIASYYTAGAIDEVRIYNRSLSADEIQNLYELGSYHIEWGEWEDEGLVSDGIAKTNINSGTGKFMQYKAILNTNDTDVSAYLLNYNITTTDYTPPDTTPPSVIINSPLSQNYTTNSIDFNVNATDDYLETCIGTIDDWTTNFTLNHTETGMLNGEYIFNVTCNDTYGNINNTEFIQFNVSAEPPSMIILFPLNGSVYEIEPTNLTFTATNALTCWQNSTGENSTHEVPTNYTGLNSIQGINTWRLWCNNTEGITLVTTEFNWSDTTSPSVSITYPINGNLYGTSPLSVTTIISDTNHDSSWTEFNGVNSTFSGNSTSLTITSTTTYILTVWVNDTFGNIANDSVSFDFAYHQDYPYTYGNFIQKWFIFNSTSGIYTNLSGIRIDGAYCNFVSGVCGS